MAVTYVPNTAEDKAFWKKVQHQTRRCLRKFPDLDMKRSEHGVWEFTGTRAAQEAYREIAIACADRLGMVGPDEAKVQMWCEHLYQLNNPESEFQKERVSWEDTKRFRVESASDRLIRN